jgi:hypothetical protein
LDRRKQSFPALSQWRAGCAIAIQQHDSRLIANRSMRTIFVVVSAPILHLFPGVRKGQELVGIEAFGPEATVERLDEGVVGRLAGPGEIERNTALVSPKIQLA